MQINKTGLKAAEDGLPHFKYCPFPNGFTQGSRVWAVNSAGLFITLPTGRGINSTRGFKPRQGASQGIKSSRGISLLQDVFSGESLHKLNRKPMKLMENKFTESC